MTPAKTARDTLKALDKLRVLVAGAIIRNQVNRDSNGTDIWRSDDAIELYEQYTIKLFVNWLGTKYGFPRYTNDINQNDQACLQPLDSWPEINDQYPGYSHLHIDLEKQLCQESYEFLDAHLDAIAIGTEAIGLLYMRSLAAPLRIDAKLQPFINRNKNERTKGEFYTPAKVVDYCFSLLTKNSQAINLNCNDAKRYAILDPACGSGNFLSGAIRFFAAQIAVDQLIGFTGSSIFGWDIDNRAVCLARLSVLLTLAKELREVLQNDRSTGIAQIRKLIADLTEHISVKDALVDSESMPAKFDLVIGNPPYISFGSRNQTAINAGWSKYLKSVYPAASEYKIRTHSLFQEIAIKRCHDGGRVILLLPDAFLNGAYYHKLRTLILEETNILSLTELPESTFSDATAGRWCITHYQKKSPAEHQVAIGDAVAEQVELMQLNPDNHADSIRFSIAPSALVSKDKSRFQLFFHPLDADLFLQLQKLPLLCTRFRGRTGIRARAGQSTIIAVKAKGPRWQKGLTSGADVNAHKISWSGKFINIDPLLLYSGGFDKKTMEEPKLLMRQTADRPIGAIDRSGLYHLNNIHSFAPLSDPRTYASDNTKELELLVTLINSTFWQYIYQLKSRETKRALAQIDIEMIESMPLPNPYSAKQKMARQALISCSEILERLAERQSPTTTTTTMSRAIDRLIYDIYELDPMQVEHIEKSTRRVDLPTSEAALELLDSFTMAPL